MSQYGWAINLSRRPEPRPISSAQTVALMLIAFFVAIALALSLSGCKQRSEPAPAVDPEHWDRIYIAFVARELDPIIKRDGMKHTGGGCEVGPADLLCVECYSPGGEAWVHCEGDACKLVSTSDELEAVGADFGACERWQSHSGLAVSFTRRAHP